MYLELICPTCTAIGRLQLDSVGQQHQCHACGCVITVPEPGQPVTEFTAHRTDTDEGSDKAADGNVSTELVAQPKRTQAADANKLGMLSGIGLIAVGGGQLAYSLYLIIHIMTVTAVSAGKIGIFVLLAAFAIIPDKNSGLLETTTTADPLSEVFLLTMLLGNVLAVTAIGGGFMICAKPGVAKPAAAIVAVCAVPLFLLHIKTGLGLPALGYLVASVLAGRYAMVDSSLPNKNQQLLP